MPVIKFRRKEQKKVIDSGEMELNELLSRAVDLKKNLAGATGQKTVSDLKHLISAKIMDALIAKRMIQSGCILCGLYISGLLGSLDRFTPESWYVTDYFLDNRTDDCHSVRKSADICFLICSLFPERGNRRSMKTSDYHFFGAGLYMHYYHLTENEIGYHMSQHFAPMAEITRLSVNEI